MMAVLTWEGSLIQNTGAPRHRSRIVPPPTAVTSASTRAPKRSMRRPPAASTPEAAQPTTAKCSTKPGITCSGASALRDIHRETTARGFLVFGAHVRAGLPHGGDDLVQRDAVRAI